MKILVDADACPKSVLRICLDVGRRHDLPVWTVASFNHSIESDHHILVGGDPQETDIKILNVTGRMMLSSARIGVWQPWLSARERPV